MYKYRLRRLESECGYLSKYIIKTKTLNMGFAIRFQGKECILAGGDPELEEGWEGIRYKI